MALFVAKVRITLKYIGIPCKIVRAEKGRFVNIGLRKYQISNL
jgi:hypothetical protein